MELSIQAVLLNVSDLKQSIDFYRDVFDLEVVSEAYRVTAVMVSEKKRRQVLLLRELGHNATHGGRGNIGPGCSHSRLGHSRNSRPSRKGSCDAKPWCGTDRPEGTGPSLASIPTGSR